MAVFLAETRGSRSELVRAVLEATRTVRHNGPPTRSPTE
ncbi:hypothetical protein GFS60_00085 [Rhodococcus sp. WAY2]|nr:hypothetical protein GFS60_00085 [Rhodococcus sp. WAY2]